jgi:hypothetical protein
MTRQEIKIAEKEYSTPMNAESTEYEPQYNVGTKKQNLFKLSKSK